MINEVMINLQGTQKDYPPVTDGLLNEIAQRILAVGNPLKIVLFGSRAKNKAHGTSDIDIMVIEEPGAPAKELQLQYQKAVRGLFPEITLLVYSLTDVFAWQNVPNYLVTEALRIGRMLYENKQALSRYQKPDLAAPPDTGIYLVCENVEPKTKYDLARQMFLKADHDLKNSRTAIDINDTFDTACFHAQQAIEKYLKGFLTFHGWSYDKTHDLKELVAQCNQFQNFEAFSKFNLDKLSEYAVCTRYDADCWPTKDEAQAALSIAQIVKAAILAAVPDGAKPKENG